MGHLHENRELRFSEIISIFKKATSGKLESVTEKLDGQNMFFTYNVAINELRFARNKGQIKSGGMDGQDIVEKWASLPNVRDAFYNAYITLNKALAPIEPETLTTIFGNQGNIWFSMEVVSTFNPNVINYNQNAIVFHKVSLKLDEQGNVVNNESFQKEFTFLEGIVDELQRNVANSKWKIMGPIVMKLKKATDDSTFLEHSKALLNEISKYQLNYSNTIGDYLSMRLAMRLPDEWPLATRKKVGDIFGNPKYTAGQRKKEIEKITDQKIANEYFAVKNQQKLENVLIAPIEHIIHNFATDVLAGVNSLIALSPDKEVQRLKSAVKSQIELIKSSGDEHAIETMNKALKKLKFVDNITSAMEGIVFKFGDRAYKLTGVFSPINQLLGLFRF